MAAATGGGAPIWLYILFPLIGTLAALIAAYGAIYPQLKDRKSKEEARVIREERLDAAADAVLGREADYRRGRLAIKGLVEISREHSAQLADILERLE